MLFVTLCESHYAYSAARPIKLKLYEIKYYNYLFLSACNCLIAQPKFNSLASFS